MPHAHGQSGMNPHIGAGNLEGFIPGLCFFPDAS
jgi:hypothetical protein